jgi:ribosomal protein S18 acetylase RimI-like enzyme
VSAGLRYDPRVRIRSLADGDRAWLRDAIAREWHLPVVSPAAVYDDPELLDGLIAEDGDEPVGAVTYAVAAQEWEVVTLQAFRRRVGVGRALMAAVRERALAAGATRVWLITTDDNPAGLAFYDAIGMTRVRKLPRFSEHVATVKPPTPDAVPYDAVELAWDLT